MPQTSTLIKTMIGSGAMMVMAVAAMIGPNSQGTRGRFRSRWA